MWFYTICSILIFILLFVMLSITLIRQIQNDFNSYYKYLRQKEQILSDEQIVLDKMYKNLEQLEEDLLQKYQDIKIIQGDNTRKLALIKNELLLIMHDNLNKETEKMSKILIKDVDNTILNKLYKLIKQKIEVDCVK